MYTLKPRLTVGFLSLMVGACVDVEGPAPQPLPPDQIMADFQITSASVMMVVGDTLQLDVRAVAMDDSDLPVDRTQVRWTSLDSAQVYVDSTGRVVGRLQSAIPVDVIASYYYGLTTLADTVSIYVTNTRLEATSIRLVPVDSTRIGGSPTFGFVRVRVDLYRKDTLVLAGAQVPISAPDPVQMVSSPTGGPNGEPVYAVNNDKNYLGPFWVRAAVNLYGTAVRDSLAFVGLYPASTPALIIRQDNSGAIQADTILPGDAIPNAQPCGYMMIIMTALTPVDIVFSDSIASGDGCAPIPSELLTSLGIPVFGDFVGGNVIGITPFTLALRRSNTRGQISYYLRDAVTKQRLPVAGRWNAVAIEDSEN